jgi:hypothetical protein
VAYTEQSAERREERGEGRGEGGGQVFEGFGCATKKNHAVFLRVVGSYAE